MKNKINASVLFINVGKEKKMRLKNTIFMVVIVTTCFFLNGCATILTTSFPPQDTFEKGEISMGEQINFNYAFTKNKNTFTLYKTPLCKEQIETIKVTQKRLRGIIPAIFEIPLYGLGIADWVTADLYSRQTRTTEKTGFENTGKIKKCGEPTVVPYADLILQFTDSGSVKHAQTDMNAQFDMNSLLPASAKTQINIFVNDNKRISYITTIDRS
jgi:hypothetical protein